MNLPNLLTEARKFLVALIAALGVLSAAMTAGSAAGSTITGSEWIGVAFAFAGALGVYAVSNGSAK